MNVIEFRKQFFKDLEELREDVNKSIVNEVALKIDDLRQKYNLPENLTITEPLQMLIIEELLTISFAMIKMIRTGENPFRKIATDQLIKNIESILKGIKNGS